MSVLFKALARAAEANQARRHAFAPAATAPEPPPLPRLPPSPSPAGLFSALARAAESSKARRKAPASSAQPAKAAPRPDSLAESDLSITEDMMVLPPKSRFGFAANARPFRAALLVLVTLLGGTLGALYYFGEDVQLIWEDLMGEEPVRQAPPVRKRVAVPQPPKPVPQAEAPARPEISQPDVTPVPPEKPKPAVEPPAVEPSPVPPPEPVAAAPAPRPEIPAATRAAEAALERATAEAVRKASQEQAVAEKAANDLPGVLEDVRRRKEQASVKPQIEVRKASGAPNLVPSVAATGTDSKIDMVSVRSNSSQSREDAERAYGLLMSGQYEGAALVYAEVLKRDSRNLSALTGRAAALHKLRQFGEARQLYQQALAISPGNREVLSNLMSILGAEDPSQALGQLEELHRDNPGFSPLPAQMASIYAQSGDLASAIRYQSQAVQLSPENLLYRFNLAVMQDRAGMTPEAAYSYEAVLSLASRGSGVSLPMPVGQVRDRLNYLRTR
ncbi:MAG: hypothetical protein HQL43_02265 [Alphaproteobacteria bacterium]|nr:hypothetical protein [Alphaproteobacteria bacterium]